MNIVSALGDKRLFGGLPCFQDLTTWEPWLTFMKAVYGLPMTEADLDRFRRHTGRQTPNPTGYPVAVAIVGVQSGKSRMAAALADFAAVTGEAGTHAVLLAQDHRSSIRVLLRYAREPFETLDLYRGEVVSSSSEGLKLRNGVNLSAYPCRPEAVRGIRACVVVIDELAFFTTSDGRQTDKEMLRVAWGRVAMTRGKVIVLSSPYGQSGALWDLCVKHHPDFMNERDKEAWGGKQTSTLVWKASAPEMNPLLSADYLERMQLEDPEAYQSEVLGEFRAGLSVFFDPEALAACVVVDGVRELAPNQAHRYESFVDAASGSGKDAFTVAVSHEDGNRAVLDVVRAWKPPFNPSGVIAEAADLLKRYGLRETTGDRYAPGFVSEGFRMNGITYYPSERDRSAIYLELLPAVNAERVVLLDEPETLRELRGLERRRGNSGRDRVDHRRGSHDDRANAAAGALVLTLDAAQRRGTKEIPIEWG